MNRRVVPGASVPPRIRPGDEVRLKFLYPGGAVEIIDGTWVAIVGLGANGQEAQSQWIVLRFEEREIWKPLSYLVQAEVLEANQEDIPLPDGIFPREADGLGYHR